ncbi:MAG: hypothetical protein V4642_03105 [Bacteroidota bacterium]
MKQHKFKLRKADAPEQGKSYLVSMKGDALYEADVLEYSGGCWAKVQVREAAENFAKMYKPGQTFDMKVAAYNFEEKIAEDAE